ncbi:GNAT family N-acetyltransferase [Neptunomonas sp. CHC150]|uniref:GNAT family N-acetyltransferase n=1 Tax=Neptunomonas sp. CHC150 TaxID=2998324 RepID=UPI0025AF0D20|nr:GNAT family N-acetyltransferase [Neptunomonas sp. CHC150]MDN2660337.1 GNAT family N-acetyltransferase [Neptunomonas sp. CHC150]
MSYRVELSHNIASIGEAQWDALAGDDHPFTRYAFLAALESSGVVSAKTGWLPMHLSIFDGDQRIAVMPMYQKSHSYGEYVFDWGWADAYHQNGIDYYPKLLTAIPFSPVTGPRILSQLATETLMALAGPLLSEIIPHICNEQGLSSWHGLFFTQASHTALPTDTFISRLGTQYHWFNRDFKTFDDFLATFSSRKRKNVKRERRKVTEQGIRLSTYEGEAITPELLRTFFHCYQLTYLKRGQQGYLNLEFFEKIINSMPESLVLFIASLDQQHVACALCFKDSHTLYGRYWGSLDDFDSLHFETCYYTGIDYCIEHGLQRFDPGAQGEHKIQRGFEPIKTWSAHYIAHPGFKEAVHRFTTEEAELMEERMSDLATLLPFKADEQLG